MKKKTVGLDLSLTGTGFCLYDGENVSVETIRTQPTKAWENGKWKSYEKWNIIDRYAWITRECLRRIPVDTDLIFIEDIFIQYPPFR